MNYNMFCEMVDKKVEDKSVFDKAAEIDECYGDVEIRAPFITIFFYQIIIFNLKMIA